MLPVSDSYRNAVYATEREFQSRATIKMDAFSQTAPWTYSETENFANKISGSTVENPNIAKFAKATTLQIPGMIATECSQSYYDAMKTVDTNPFDIYSASSGQFGQLLVSFDIFSYLERKFGKYIWQGKDSGADKATIAKSYISQFTLNWTGFGKHPKKSVFSGVRYVRDYVNGSTANVNAYWNSIKAFAGTVDRCAGKTPTSNGTITNPLNLTDGNDATYGYIASTGSWYAQVDLGQVYTDIDRVQIIHYYADGRTFHGTKTQISADGVTWTTLYDSAVSGEYAETSTGKTYNAPVATTYDYGAWINVWKPTTNDWGILVAGPALSGYSTVTKTPNTNDLIGSDGFIHWIVYGGVASATMAAELFTDYVEMVMTLNITNVRQFYDDTVMKINILEEINVLNDSLPSNQLTLTMDNSSGVFNLLNFTNMPGILNSKPTIGIEFGLVIDDIGTVEWKEAGWFIMTSWSTDFTNAQVTITGNDYFYVLGDIVYTPLTTANLTLSDIANDVLAKGGVPIENRIIDPALDIVAGNFTDTTDCRSALQDIAIAGRVCVYQDRMGNVTFAPFTTIDKISNFLLYSRTQLSVSGNYPGANTFSIVNTESGMKLITYDEMFNPPDVTIDPTIYQLVINVYTQQADGTWDSTEHIYPNETFNGQNGQSFTIDNQLVISVDIADKIADWYFSESNYNAEYKANWRGNPALEPTDLVLIEDPYNANKQTRVFRQEFNYEGYLTGTTESRGGV